MNGARVRFAWACAARETLTGEVRQRVAVAWVAIDRRSKRCAVERLIRRGAHVACVVSVRPL